MDRCKALYGLMRPMTSLTPASAGKNKQALMLAKVQEDVRYANRSA